MWLGNGTGDKMLITNGTLSNNTIILGNGSNDVVGATDCASSSNKIAVGNGQGDLIALAAPIHRQRCFSEILVRGDFGCGSSFGFFTA